MFSEKVEKKNEHDQKQNHKKVPLVPAFEQRCIVVLFVFHVSYRLRIIPDANKPIAKPKRMPTFTCLIRAPMPNPNKIINTNAILPRTLSGSRVLIKIPFCDSVQECWQISDTRRVLLRAIA